MKSVLVFDRQLVTGCHSLRISIVFMKLSQHSHESNVFFSDILIYFLLRTKFRLLVKC